MHTTSLYKYLLLGGIYLGLVVGGCDSSTVDKEYLKSELYQQFNSAQKREYVAQVDGNKTLIKYLNQLIKCEKGTALSLPLQFTKTVLKKSGNHCESLREDYAAGFEVKMLGYTQVKPITIRWVLVDKESVYDNRELMIVTHQDSTLSGFQSIGVFRKNLSKNISSDITVSQKGDFVYISSVSNRRIKYPVEVEHTVRRRFLVNKDGEIITKK